MEGVKAEEKVKLVVNVENGQLKADIDAGQEANIKAIADALAAAPPVANGGSSRGGKSKRNRKSRGGKSRKGRKSLRRK